MKQLVAFGFFLLITLFVATPSFAFSAGPLIRVKQGASTNWAGYAALTNLTNPQSGMVNDVKGSWIVPSLVCGSTNTYSSTWVGMDGYSNSTVEQTGTEADCSNGVPVYYAWYEMYPKPGYYVPISVKAGDTVAAEVSYSGGRHDGFSLTLANKTTGETYTTVQRSSKAQRASAEWIVEAPWSGGVLPLANFGTLNVTNSFINGLAVNGAHGFVTDKINMVTSDGSIIKALTSDFTSPTDFSVTWQHE